MADKQAEVLTPEKELIEAEFLNEVFMKKPINFEPHSLISQVYYRVLRRTRSFMFSLAAVYLMGYIYGVRAERQRRKGNIQS